MAKRFDQDSRIPTRALQAYLVLIGCAWNKQIITYGGLSKGPMKHGTGGVLSDVLGCVMGWCFEQGLPPLTVLVVNDKTGLPGSGLGTVEADKFPAAMQKVFKVNWYDLLPPTIAELEVAGKRAASNQLKAPKET